MSAQFKTQVRRPKIKHLWLQKIYLYPQLFSREKIFFFQLYAFAARLLWTATASAFGSHQVYATVRGTSLWTIAPHTGHLRFCAWKSGTVKPPLSGHHAKVHLQGSTRTEKWEGIFQSGNFEQTGKVRENRTEYLKSHRISEKCHLFAKLDIKYSVKKTKH